MRYVSIFLLFIMLLPATASAQSASETMLRQQLIALIQSLQIELAARLGQQGMPVANIDSARLRSQDFSEGVNFIYPADKDFSFYMIENGTEFGEDIDTRSWHIVSNNTLVGNIDLGNELVSEAFEAALAVVELAAMFSGFSDTSIDIEDLPRQNGYDIKHLVIEDAGEVAGTYIAQKELTYRGESYIVLLRIVYGNLESTLESVAAQYDTDFDDFYFPTKAEARNFFNTVVRETEFDVRAISRVIENTDAELRDLIEDARDEGPEDEEEFSVRPVSRADHYQGSLNAEVQLISYIGFDDPFSRNLHETRSRIMDEYDAREVVWVYRNFPIAQLHPNGPALAAAAECVATEGGNTAYWKFVDKIFSDRTASAKTDMDDLPSYARSAGVSTSRFNTCVEEGETEAVVTADFEEGVAAGVVGTPHTVVIVGDKKGVINGAQPYAVVKQTIDNLLMQLD